MNIENKLRNIARNKKIKNIFSMVVSPDFPRLPFSEKKAILEEYNAIIEKALDTSLALYINRSESNKGRKDRAVSLSVENSSLVIDGISRNPYFYLRDILLMHLIYLNDCEYFALQIGGVTYSDNYMEIIPELSLYNETNINFVRTVNDFIKSFMPSESHPYKSEYEKSLDNVLTYEGSKDMIKAYNIINHYCSDGIFDELSQIFEELDSIFSKKKLTKKELALLSLDEVVSSYFTCVVGRDFQNNNSSRHYSDFLKAFFKEYSEDVKIEITNDGTTINGRRVTSDEMFMDVLMQEIEKVEKTLPRIEGIISDEELAKFNVNGKRYTKLDLYFYKSLKNLDGLLENRNLELINYLTWTKIFKDNTRKKIFNSHVGIFSQLTEDKEFLSIIKKILNLETTKLDLYFNKLIKKMNEVYGAEFKLNLTTDATTDTSMGTADHDKCIYLNLNNNFDRVELLATFFHEYRHLMQYKEIQHNTGIYNDKGHQIIAFNAYETPFKKDYNYASVSDSSYNNNLLYCMQPLELDAEDFAEAMLVKIFSHLKNPPTINRFFFADTYSNSVYMDREMISLVSYSNFLKIDKVEEVVKKEQKDYKVLMELIKQATTKEDAIEVFKHRNFTNLSVEEKLKIYKLLAGKNVDINYDKPNNILYMAGKKYYTKEISDFSLIEQIIILDAKRKLKEGRIRSSEYKDYIYNESRKYKAEKYDMFNCLQLYDYHFCFDKYYRSPQKINIMVKRK